jgi:predicted transcriptional regulator
MDMTTNEIASKLGVERDTAYKLISFMKEMGMIGVVGVRPNPAGKGKGSDLFNIDPPTCSKKISDLLHKLA